MCGTLCIVQILAARHSYRYPAPSGCVASKHNGTECVACMYTLVCGVHVYTIYRVCGVHVYTPAHGGREYLFCLTTNRRRRHHVALDVADSVVLCNT